MAKSKSYSDSLEEQARDLISAMETDPGIDMNKNWKVRERQTEMRQEIEIFCSSAGDDIQWQHRSVSPLLFPPLPPVSVQGEREASSGPPDRAPQHSHSSGLPT